MRAGPEQNLRGITSGHFAAALKTLGNFREVSGDCDERERERERVTGVG